MEKAESTRTTLTLFAITLVVLIGSSIIVARWQQTIEWVALALVVITVALLVIACKLFKRFS